MTTEQEQQNMALDKLGREHDGTSQADRKLPALNPDYIAIDERSIKELLAFARQYARQLRFYHANNGTVEADGDWHDFLPDDAGLHLDDIVDYLENAQQLSADKAQLLARPHVVLFLTFLKLLQHSRNYLNTLTRRHLDFYYQQVLHMLRKVGTPDSVNVLVKLSTATPQYELPAGTLLNAGVDSLGRDLVYRTNRRTIINQAQVEQISSLYVEQQIIGIREAHKTAFAENKLQDAVMRMLEIALGSPQPGDSLPPYTDLGALNYDKLKLLKNVVDFVNNSASGLWMTFFDFETMMERKANLLGPDTEADWDRINELLQKAARTRIGNPNFQLPIADPYDFNSNLNRAVTGDAAVAPNFDGVTDVENVEDLYNQPIDRESVQTAIHEILFFESVADFQEMMRLKLRIDSGWEEINLILRDARRKKSYPLAFDLPGTDADDENYDPNFNRMDFASNLQSTLGELVYPAVGVIQDIDTFYEKYLYLGKYFHISPGDFQYVMDKTLREPTAARQVSGQEWETVYSILEAAHRKNVNAQRLVTLKTIRETDGFDAMMLHATGESESTLPAFERLLEFVSNSSDRSLLNQIQAKQAAQPPQPVTDEEWLRVYSIVAQAQGIREGEKPAQKVEWRNLYPTADATTLKITSGIPDDKDTPRWETFGRRPTVAPKAEVPAPVFGWALASPLLVLNMGRRTVKLTLGFEAQDYDADAIKTALALDATGITPLDLPMERLPFVVQVSTDKGWIESDALRVAAIDYKSLPPAEIANPGVDALPALQFTLTFNEAAAPLAPLPPKERMIDNPCPVLRLMLRQQPVPDSQHYTTYYAPFRHLVLRRTHLRVEVNGLIPSHIQNDESSLNPAKPFEPFGFNPAVGSRFYIGDAELLNKRLDSLTFNIEWMGLPDNNLGNHYKNYNVALSNASFKTRISLIDQQRRLDIHPAADLFVTLAANTPRVITKSGFSAELESNNPSYKFQRLQTPDFDNDDLLHWTRYLQWELNDPDFQHSGYVAQSMAKAAEFAYGIANKSINDAQKGNYTLKPPYTPKIKQMKIDYTAAEELQIEQQLPHNSLDMIYHIQPFGYSELLSQTERLYFLPQFNFAGELYIGLRGVKPPQEVALLFQMAEGSANPDLEPVEVQWHYLSGNRWLPLAEGLVLQDTTRGLINSGIIEFSLQPTAANTLLKPDLYWLRAVIANHTDSVCDTVQIATQAVNATFVDHDNAPDHLSRPLPAASITDLVKPVSQIVGILQPYTSFGGKMPEQETYFYTRISERLRHKQRAVTLWDYEHLILERFPQVYKAKCLPARPQHLGLVEVIVIPDIRNKLPFNPFEPKAAADLLADIETYLQPYTPAYARVKVRNPRYIALKVRFGVRFLPNHNEGFYKQQLNQELNRFLAPWAYDEGADIVIGGKIHASVIIDFIEERPYVDYVAQVKLFKSNDGSNFAWVNATWVETTHPDEILVAAVQHEIDIISDTGYEIENFVGINYMKIELDFVVAEDL